MQQFSIGPEFQFAENMVGAVEYVGNRTRNGRRLRNLNEGIISGNTVTFPYRGTRVTATPTSSKS